MAGKKGKSGGKREGAGQPPKKPNAYSDQFKDDVLAAVKELEKENKATFLKQAFSLMYDDKTQSSVKASLLKTFSEIFAVNKSETKIEGLISEPTLYIPDRDEEG